MPSKHKVGLDLTGQSRLAKRGWRSGLPNSWGANQQYQHNIRAGLIRNYPDRINRMANGAWQFFFMADDDWFERTVPKPEPGESLKDWAGRTEVWLTRYTIVEDMEVLTQAITRIKEYKGA